MSTQTKQKIKGITRNTAGVITLFLIYFSTFYTTFSLTDKALNGTQDKVSTQEARLVSKGE